MLTVMTMHVHKPVLIFFVVFTTIEKIRNTTSMSNVHGIE